MSIPYVSETQMNMLQRQKKYLEAQNEIAALSQSLPRVNLNNDGGVVQLPPKDELDEINTLLMKQYKIKALREMLEGGPASVAKKDDGEKAETSPQAYLGKKAELIGNLAKAGKSPAEVEEYLAKLGPTGLEIAATAKDPATQSLLMSQVLNQKGQPSMIEVFQM